MTPFNDAALPTGASDVSPTRRRLAGAGATVRATAETVTGQIAATMTTLVVTVLVALHSRDERARARGERGDVPGWVLITLMTAGLVTAIWAVAQTQLSQIFQQAIHSVKAP